jgi:transcriptional regulator with XRE-family HTH domain
MRQTKDPAIERRVRRIWGRSDGQVDHQPHIPALDDDRPAASDKPAMRSAHQDVAMTAQTRRTERGTVHAERVLRTIGEEMRSARVAAGLSQRAVARASGVSASRISRLEHAMDPSMPLAVCCRVGAVLGLRLSVRAYPEAAPIRDAAHVALLRRLRDCLPDSVRMRTEVPIRATPGDLRAWDAVLLFAQAGTVGQRVRRGGLVTSGTAGLALPMCRVEAETVVDDVQALERRVALKMEAGGVDQVLLLIAATKRNRAVLRMARPLLRDRFPLDSRAILQALRAGGCPGQGGIVLL